MNTKMSLEQMVEYMKNNNSNVPDWLLDIDRLKSGAELSRDEMLEYAECFCSQARSVEALTYLIECEKRFRRVANITQGEIANPLDRTRRSTPFADWHGQCCKY